MRGLGLAGLIAATFGVGSYYATGEVGAFGRINLVAGAVALAVAGVLGLRRVSGFGTPAARGLLARRALEVAILLAVGIGLERAATQLGLRFDWTLDQRYALSPATLGALGALPDDLEATLFYDPEDPRVRGTRLLLSSFAHTGELIVRERILDEAPGEADRFGVSSSNSVVLETGERYELVGRPTEGTIWEALELLRRRERHAAVYFSRGAGEGDPLRGDLLGYSGLAAALLTEGYIVRDLVLAATDAIPEDAAAIVVISPERALRPESIALLEAYLAGGGGLIAFLQPGDRSGLLPLLEDWGFASPDGIVVDAASGTIEGGVPGVNPLAYAYAEHPITGPLDANRMTFFLRARPMQALRKPRPEDFLRSLVFTSPRAWLSPDVEAVSRGLRPGGREDQALTRFALASAGSYPRGPREARIVAFGDSDLASNAYLRTLFNLDLVMNSINWVAARQDANLTRRPSVITEIQSPLTPQETLRMFYSAGLLLPELLLIAAALTWTRRRSA